MVLEIAEDNTFSVTRPNDTSEENQYFLSSLVSNVRCVCPRVAPVWSWREAASGTEQHGRVNSVNSFYFLKKTKSVFKNLGYCFLLFTFIF